MASPLVIAHRGGAPGYPENSLAAFRHALASGVDMLECDVRRSADGALVLLHDPRVSLGGGPSAVSATPLTALRAAVPALLTLPEFLEEFIPSIPVNVDLKAAGWERELARVLVSHDASDRVLVSSTHVPSLRRLAAIEPGLALGLSRGHLASSAPGEPGRAAAGLWLRATLPLLLIPSIPLARARAAMLQRRSVGPTVVRLLRRLGYRVFTWTVNRPDDALRLAACGVDGIASDDPTPVMAALAAAGFR